MAKKRKKKSAPVVVPAVETETDSPVAPAAEAASVPAATPLAPDSRRHFLAQAGNLAVCACALGTVAGSVRVAVPDFFDGPPEAFALGNPSDFKTGTLTWVSDKDLFVARDELGFAAFSSRCTHLGCTVRRTAEGFFCPCHGAKYDEQGLVTAGPARDPLPWFHLWIEPDGRIWVNTGKTVPVGTKTNLMDLGAIEDVPAK